MCTAHGRRIWLLLVRKPRRGYIIEGAIEHLEWSPLVGLCCAEGKKYRLS